MFEQSMVTRRAERRPAMMLLSLGLQMTFLIVALLVPLIFSEVLPATQLSTLFVLPKLPVVRAAATAPKSDPTVRRTRVKSTATNVFTAPAEIPKHVARIVDEIEVDPHLAALARQLPLGESGSSLSKSGLDGLVKFLGQSTASAPPPPVAEKSAPREIQRIKRGGTVLEAMALSRPAPAYPELAKRARIEGEVHLRAVISQDGSIQELSVLMGHPLLVKAAVEAVSQWRYRPTILNGEPVEVLTQITVTFRLR
jgi:protein TonB